MCFHRIVGRDDEAYGQMMEVFEASFPECERRPKDWFDRLLYEEPRFHCMVYGRGDAMLCYWELACGADDVRSPFVYVEYLAVREELRGGGIGTEVMRAFMSSMADTPVVLEVELPVCPQARRRVSFYEKLGLRLMPDYYVQPSYGVLPGLEMKLMVFAPCEMGWMTIGDMARVIRSEVYGVAN